MDEQQTEQQQNDEAFSAGFDSVRHSEGYEPPPEKLHEETVAKEEAAAKPEPEETPVEEAMFAGLTESQIKSLLQRAARVDSIEEQLGKAHGKIGELNRTLQEIRSTGQRPTQNHAPADSVDDQALSEFESTFPEFAPAVEARARRIAQEVLQQAQQTQSAGDSSDPEAIGKAVSLALMDDKHPDWRKTVASDDFALWIASQPDGVRQTYASTWDHRELGGILGKFSASQRAVVDRATKSKQRLEAALTPDGSPSRVAHATSDQDAFIAGFESVRNPRYY